MTDIFRVATPRVAAGALVRDRDGRIVLVRQRATGRWDLPGGYVEPGESPRDAVIREIAEELGTVLTVGALLAVDWAPRDTEGDKILFVFAATADSDALLDSVTLQDVEIAEIAYVAESDLPSHLDDRLLKRIRSAVSGSGPYLEHGDPPE